MSKLYIIVAIIFMAIPQAFSSYELLGSEFDKENGCRNRKNPYALKIPPTFKEQPTSSIWLEIEGRFRQTFTLEKKSYDLFRMIKELKLMYGDNVAFCCVAKDMFKVHEPEHIQFLWHCCKEVKEREEELRKELRKQKKELRYPHTREVIMETIEKYADWSK
jgi:hypothetical protein